MIAEILLWSEQTFWGRTSETYWEWRNNVRTLGAAYVVRGTVEVYVDRIAKSYWAQANGMVHAISAILIHELIHLACDDECTEEQVCEMQNAIHWDKWEVTYGDYGKTKTEVEERIVV